MQKAADAADISVLFFSAGANFGAILGHFWAISAILGNFWAIWVILGHFGPFFGANFLWQNMHLCYLNRFLQLWLVDGNLELGIPHMIYSMMVVTPWSNYHHCGGDPFYQKHISLFSLFLEESTDESYQP